MLTKIANFIAENPIIVIIGFICSVIGTIEVIYSLVINLKTKKQKEEIERQQKEIYEYLKNEVEFSTTSRELEKVKSDLEEARKEMKIKIPNIIKQAALNEQIMIEEQIIRKAQERIQKLKTELDEDRGKNAKTPSAFLKKLDDFITKDQTKSFAVLLVILGVFLIFIRQIIGGLVAKVFGILGACIIISYAYNKYEKLQGEKVKKVTVSFVNVALCLYITNTLTEGNINGILWWAFLVLLLSFLRIIMRQNLDISTLVSILCIPLFIAIFIVNEYEAYLVIAIFILQILVLLINIINIAKEIKSD